MIQNSKNIDFEFPVPLNTFQDQEVSPTTSVSKFYSIFFFFFAWLEQDHMTMTSPFKQINLRKIEFD